MLKIFSKFYKLRFPKDNIIKVIYGSSNKDKQSYQDAWINLKNMLIGIYGVNNNTKELALLHDIIKFMQDKEYSINQNKRG